MAIYITEDGNVYYENVPEEKRALFPNLAEGGGGTHVNTVEVSGTEVEIEGVDNTIYICGELETLTVTVPETGMIDIIFESGSTPTVLDFPETVLFPSWFDVTSIEANAIYEINILEGIYATVTFWLTYVEDPQLSVLPNIDIVPGNNLGILEDEIELEEPSDEVTEENGVVE